MNFKLIKWLKLIGSILLCQMAGIIGSIFTVSAIPLWYVGLNKPFFSPPNWLFGPVWLTLYTLLGISLYLILESKSKKEKDKAIKYALSVFLVHLVFNATWSITFFGLRSPLFGLINIVLLDVLAYYSAYLFYKIKPLAGYLLIPYLAWITFATILNGAILVLN